MAYFKPMSDTTSPKRAVFLHGTSGHPGDHWWPWLKDKFERSNYEVWAPELPDNDRPNTKTYWDFLTSQNWDFRENVLVGHSSGATTILNLLANPDFPKVKTAVLVGVFLNEDLTSKSADFEQTGQFASLFPKSGSDWSVIKQKAEKFYFVHGDDDPYCSYQDALEASKQLGGELITIDGGGHLSSSFGVTELPRLVAVLERDNILS